jgi:hypothetical protein
MSIALVVYSCYHRIILILLLSLPLSNPHLYQVPSPPSLISNPQEALSL